MLADFHVVTDLDQIVDFRPLAYHRLAQGRAIDRRPGSNFNVIFDPDDTDLRDLVMLAIVHGKAVPIGADDDARVDDAPAANARAVVNDYVGIDDRIVSQRGSSFDRDILENRHVVAHDDIVSNRRERADGHILSQPCGGRNGRQRRHSFRHRPRGKPARHDARNREVRIIDADPALIFTFQILRHQNGARLCLGQLRGVFAIAQEAQMLAAGSA